MSGVLSVLIAADVPAGALKPLLPYVEARPAIPSPLSRSGQVRSVAELATVEGISDRYVSSLLPLAFLDIVEAIASGRQPPDLTAHRLIRTVELPIAWAAQKQLLGLG